MPPQEQPASEAPGDQPKNITQQTQDTEQTQDTRDTRNTQQTDLTHAFLALLGIQSGSDASTAVGSAVGGMGVGVVATPTAPTPAEASVETREARSPDRQQTSTEATTSLTGSRSRVVDCRPCGGCCGNRVGFRVPAVLYDLLLRVAEREGVPLCRLLSDELCGLVELVRGRGRRVGVSERGLSRRVQYKASYLLKMIAEAGELGQVIDRLVLAVREYLEYAERRRVGVEETRQSVEDLARELGFSGIRDFALYLWWLVPSRVIEVMEGLVSFGYAERRGPYVDVLSVRCVLPHDNRKGWSVHTTMNLPGFLRDLITHFKHVHGLVDWRDVARSVIYKPWRDQVVDELGSEEGELGSEDWERLTPKLKLYILEDVLGMLVEVLASLGLVIDLGHNEYKCVLDGVIVRGRYNLFKHLRNEHRELGRAVKLLLEALARGARANGVEGEGEGGGVVVDEGAE